MEQNFDIGLNAKINEFAKKFNIDREKIKDDDIFEDFANYTIASTLLEEEVENVKSVSTNKAQGIDGIAIIINDKLISEESDLAKFGESEPIKIRIGFIQSTIKGSFDEQKLRAFTDEVVNFLVGKSKIEPYYTIYSKLLDVSGDYISRIVETPRVSLFFLSARTSHNIQDDKINIEKAKITSRNELENKCHLDNFCIYQKEEIKNEYDKISKFHTPEITFEKSVSLSSVDKVELSLLTIIKFSELKKLILTPDGNLKERLFVENVRSYIGSTNVNLDIRNTLNTDSQKQYFPFLNNGLVIICDKIERHPVIEKSFKLTFPRIINGCQTTNELFKKYKKSNDIDSVEIVAKVISTKDNEIKKRIIYSANNQNSISKDLQSLNEFHEKIENYFLGKDSSNYHLYFERLRGQHSNVIPPYSKINIETLARVFISVFLKKPHEMKSSALAIIENYQEKKLVFDSANHNPNQYYYCGVLWYWFNYLLLNEKFTLRSKTMDMHVLMASDIFLEKKQINSIDNKISFLDNENNATNLILDTVNILNNQEYLFERRGLYSNPKTQELITFLTNANPTTNN